MRVYRLIRPLIAVAVVFCVLVAAFSASAKREAKYIGTAECKNCHADSHPALVKAYDKSMHASAMSDIAAKPAAAVGKFEGDCPFKKEEVKYVLGTGKVYQNYLDKDLKMLPGKWMTKEQKWVPAEQVDAATQCVGCHTTNFDPEARTWTQLGVGCESCHGPGAAHAESMEAKDIVDLRKLDAKKRSAVCGQCHAVGTDPTGKFAFSTTFIPGQDLDKHFKLKEGVTGGQNSQYNTFITSKHYQGGMGCTPVCHDSHGDKAKAEHQLKKPINDLCITCHKAKIGSMKEHAPSAGPNDTCATCHMPEGSHAFKKAEKK